MPKLRHASSNFASVKYMVPTHYRIVHTNTSLNDHALCLFGIFSLCDSFHRICIFSERFY